MSPQEAALQSKLRRPTVPGRLNGRPEAWKTRDGGSPQVGPRPGTGLRPTVRGKFIYVGAEKLYVRGVTYGTFAPGPDGEPYPAPALVRQDFKGMARAGINAVRTYTVPPLWLLDAARDAGLWVMVGLPWEQHVAFLDDRRRKRSIVARVREGARVCAGHPALLCFAVGNEIPASIVRWHGGRPIERFLRRLHGAVKHVDPEALVTYVNFPSTEYLELPFVDFQCFNVYLESQPTLAAYLRRLQNLAGDRPLVMAEIGLDSARNGEVMQAETLEWQVDTAFGAGCAGAFLFAWTDEWHRGGHDIEDWDFGLVRRDRTAKPALAAVAGAFGRVPLAQPKDAPPISVAVCTYNGAATIRECLESVERLEYPRYEVIVVDDGSTDETAAIVDEFPAVRLIRTASAGLANARNTALAAARGDIVAYLDDDAFADPHWLAYLARTYMTTAHVAVGGPNIPPPDEGFVARCVARAPGGPIHVLIGDDAAEHVPGCNMSVRRDALAAIGGFDPQFHAAGDDVDVCWRLHAEGWTIGFAPAASVWHRRRTSVRGYLRQQRGYGRAEALLECKWPERYNDAGHVRWAGRLYGGLLPAARRRRRVGYGTWGTNAFQSVYDSPTGTLGLLPQTPEWYLLIAVLGVLAAVSAVWAPLMPAVPLLALAAAPVLLAAGAAALRADRRGERHGWALVAGTFVLHLLQPAVRLRGRIQQGLTPWRSRAHGISALGRPRTTTMWSETWRAQEDWLAAIEETLFDRGIPVVRGSAFDRHDLRVRGGLGTGAHLQMAVEEHGSGRQLLRFRVTPRLGPVMPSLVVALVIAAVVVSVSSAHLAGGLIAIATALTVLAVLRSSTAIAAILHVIEHESVDALDAVAAVEGLDEPTADGALPAVADGSVNP
jgi:O-antigen biosynthesis protein